MMISSHDESSDETRSIRCAGNDHDLELDLTTTAEPG